MGLFFLSASKNQIEIQKIIQETFWIKQTIQETFWLMNQFGLVTAFGLNLETWYGVWLRNWNTIRAFINAISKQKVVINFFKKLLKTSSLENFGSFLPKIPAKQNFLVP